MQAPFNWPIKRSFIKSASRVQLCGENENRRIKRQNTCLKFAFAKQFSYKVRNKEEKIKYEVLLTENKEEANQLTLPFGTKTIILKNNQGVSELKLKQIIQ